MNTMNSDTTMTGTKQIEVTANGSRFTIPEGQALDAFVRARVLDPDLVVVERNLEAVTPSERAAVRLQDGDRLEIVRIVAGG